MATKMVDLARTPEEQKAMQKAYSKPVNPNAPQYSYGTSITLGRSELEKLGIDELPKPGDEINVVGQAKVTHVRMEAGEGDDEDSKSVTLQITHLAVDDGEADGDADDKPNKAEKLYPKKG